MNMKTTTIVYAVLFCVSMGAAYLTWKKAPEEADEESGVVLIDAKPEDIDRIDFKTKETDVSLEVKKDALGQYIWVLASREVDKSPPNPHGEADEEAVPDEEPQAPKGERTTSAFKAGSAGDQLLAELAPFRVARELTVAPEKLGDFGLDAPGGSLIIKTKAGQTHTFEVGDTAYGHKHVYLRDASAGKVYVIKRSIVGPLERADTRLPEKELFAGPTTEITRVSISAPNGELTFVQRNRDDATKATWTPPDSDATNISAGSWLDKVFRLRSAGYASEKETPTEPVFKVKLEFADAPAVELEVMRGADASGEEAWFARSGYTRGLVMLDRAIATDAAADLGTIFGVGE